MLDTILINSRFMRGIVSMILRKAIRKKLGSNTEVSIYKIEAKADDENVMAHIDICISMPKEEFKAYITKKI